MRLQLAEKLTQISLSILLEIEKLSKKVIERGKKLMKVLEATRGLPYDTVEPRPKLQNNLLDIVTSERFFKITYHADVAKMIRCIRKLPDAKWIRVTSQKKFN